jgi:PKD repeat protein
MHRYDLTRLLTLLLVIFILALTAASCSGKRASEMRPALPGAAAQSLPNLPTPQQLLRLTEKGASFYDLDLLKSGAAFGIMLPNSKVAANGDFADFSPAWDAAGSHTFTDLAYATYQFNASGYLGEAALYLGWHTPPTDFSNLYIGLANFTRNRWDWLAGPSDPSLAIPQLLTDYRAGDGRVFAVALMLGTAPSSLNWISIGGAMADAALTATPAAGPGPLDVTLDASASYAPSGITKYEWDFDADGIYDLETGATPTAQTTYSPGGQHHAVVRVTAAGGGMDTAATAITVYNETEDNDDAITANQLPSLAQAVTWYGSAGTGEGYPGYDGDEYDYFRFDANAGDSVSLILTLDPTKGDLDLSLLDSGSSNQTLAYSRGTTAVETISYTFIPGDVAPFYICVRAYKNFSDYSLQVGKGSVPVAKLAANPTSGAIPLLVSFNASGSTDPDGLPLAKFEWDFNGDGIYDQDTGAIGSAQHTYGSDGVNVCTVRVTDATGFTATAAVTISAGAIPYDEREDNDMLAQANALPAFGFTGFRGSSGSGSGYAQYDGDADDYFSFPAATGDTVTIVLHLNPASSDLDLYLYDATNKFLKSSTSTTAAVEQVTYTILDSDTAPFYAKVHAYSGYSDYTLDGVFGAAPEAQLSATPTVGAVPLTVTLSAAASSDDGSIVQYEWDFDGDGVYDDNTGVVPSTNHIYFTAGFFSPAVRVTDNTGMTDIASTSVNAGMEYDEEENNDSATQANPLSAFPFTGFGGSCGSGSGYTGYDNDDVDFYTFTATTGQTLDLTMTIQPVHGDLDIELLDGAGARLSKSTGTSATEHINYKFQSGDSGPYYLRVYKYSGYSDYLLAGDLT